MNAPFHGSYLPEDVTFLLKPIVLPQIAVLEKERRIQSGESHYSEMLSPEHAPSERYCSLFHEAMVRNQSRFAKDVLLLARTIHASHAGPLTLISLARAGTPIGVLLRRCLATYFARDVRHYSISIIRDKGVDANALRYILGPEGRPVEGCLFVDGWTGKGVIQHELRSSIRQFNRENGTHLSSQLYVVADLCGVADICATTDDYLIPSSIMNAPVSGLISRSVLHPEYIGPDDFHGCVYYREFETIDLSQWFIDTMMATVEERQSDDMFPSDTSRKGDASSLRRQSQEFLETMMKRYDVRSVNYVKPGIGEATRVLLRRTPHLLLLRDANDSDVHHLLALAREKVVPMVVQPDLPYKAAALIQHLSR